LAVAAKKNSNRAAAIILAAVCSLDGCSVTSPIQPADSSKSGFDGAVYKGTTATVSRGTPGNEQYRVFQQGATGFVSLQSVRETAEQRAREYCGRKGRTMESVQETTASPPYILGNFPRIEIVFDCVRGPLANQSGDDPKYSKLMNLKSLLDSGVITQTEFDAEKAKILSQP
jgi:Short C-terminal domain